MYLYSRVVGIYSIWLLIHVRFIFFSQAFIPLAGIFLRTDILCWFFIIFTYTLLISSSNQVYTHFICVVYIAYLQYNKYLKPTLTHSGVETSKYVRKKNKNKPNLCYFFLFNVSFCLHFSSNFFYVLYYYTYIIHVPISIYIFLLILIRTVLQQWLVFIPLVRIQKFYLLLCHRYGTMLPTLPLYQYA